MKAILVGLGNFGSYWYRQLQEDSRGLTISVVERNERLKETVDPHIPFYSSLAHAIDAERPDFVINVTPPHMHTNINEIAFAHRLPVICEKPICNDYTEAGQIVAKAEQLGIPFMISENYRYFAPVRKVKELLDGGAIGELSSMHADFARYHRGRGSGSYFDALEFPLLQDVSIHHFDMVRYLSGKEPLEVFAKCSNPPGSWSSGSIHAAAWMELENGAVVDYSATMMARGTQSEWYGNWRFEGTDGAVTLAAGRVELLKPGEPDETHVFTDLGDVWTIDEFLAALKEKREPRPSGRDYLKSQAIVLAAGLSSKTGRVVNMERLLEGEAV